MSDNPEKKPAPAPEEHRPAAAARPPAAPPAAAPQRMASMGGQAAHAFEDLLEAWFMDHFPGSPVSRDTAAYNHTRAAVDDLKRRMSGRR